MKSGKDDQQDQAKKTGHIELRDVDSFIWLMPKILGKLVSKIKILPKVDEKGQSECPFAEDLYAQKDKAAKEFVEELEKGSKYLKFIDEEIAKHRRNLSRIRSDHGSLHNAQAKEKYNNAVKSQEFHIEKNIQRREKLKGFIFSAEKLLQQAQEKKWPGGKPKESYRISPPIARGEAGGSDTKIQGSSPVMPVHQRPALKTQIDDLMSLGPLGNKDS